MKWGIIRESKVPSDRRVPLLPYQCRALLDKYPKLSIVVQPSDVRCISNKEYTEAGITLQEDLSDCDVLFGIKEVPAHLLIPNKTYVFFSHTIKEQAHNQKLLQSILEKNITLIDYEALKDVKGNRVIAFGRFAGVVGAYNTFLLYGKKYRLFDLKPAHKCFDRKAMEEEMKKIHLPPLKIVVTGRGRVGSGIQSILNHLKIREVSPTEFLNRTFSEAVYTVVSSKDYHQSKEGIAWDAQHFHAHPELYNSTFLPYAKAADILIAGAYWDQRGPMLFTVDQMKDPSFHIRLISDITCDINGSIPSTVKPTNIYDPAYDYNPFTRDLEAPFSDPRNITVMAIDNLPCELPRDASDDFGKQFMENVAADLIHYPYGDLIERCAVTKDGKLTEAFSYLKRYAGV
ncbi:MAG: NAD(P)-dependent oxidoreductase [Cytophagaceae bacterium]